MLLLATEQHCDKPFGRELLPPSRGRDVHMGRQHANAKATTVEGAWYGHDTLRIACKRAEMLPMPGHYEAGTHKQAA
jgi:hypothetical protein